MQTAPAARRGRCPLCSVAQPQQQLDEVAAGAAAFTARTDQAALLDADTQRQAAWDAMPAHAPLTDIREVQPPGPAVQGAWHAIDDYSVFDCVVSPCGHVVDVPEALRADWATAHVDVFEYLQQARASQDQVAIEQVAQ